jgi:hypothetical protein
MDYEEEEDEQEEQVAPQVTGEAANDGPYLDLRGARENQAYAILNDRVFTHTRDFDPTLLEKTCMDFEFTSIWYALGWEEFVPVTELGSQPLTIQFLYLLVEEANDIKF